MIQIGPVFLISQFASTLSIHVHMCTGRHPVPNVFPCDWPGSFFPRGADFPLTFIISNSLTQKDEKCSKKLFIIKSSSSRECRAQEFSALCLLNPFIGSATTTIRPNIILCIDCTSIRARVPFMCAVFRAVVHKKAHFCALSFIKRGVFCSLLLLPLSSMYIFISFSNALGRSFKRQLINDQLKIYNH